MPPISTDSGFWTAVWTFALFVVTGLLVWGAFLAAVYAKRTWEIAKIELDTARDAEMKREAARVAGWIREMPNFPSLLEIIVANANPLPVFDVEVRVIALVEGGSGPLARKPIWGMNLPVLPEGKHETSIDAVNYINGSERAGGGRTENGPIPDWNSWSVWSGKEDQAGIAVEMSFRDSFGTYWKRGIKGDLTRRADDAAPALEATTRGLSPEKQLQK